MAVTVYRWDDASAPAMPIYVTGDEAIINILDGCLVTGYGTKVAAGWSKPFYDAATHRAVFKQGGAVNNHFIQIDDNATAYYSKARGYVDMTGLNTGTGQFPTTAQEATCYIAKGATSGGIGSKWVVIADERTFYLFLEDELYPAPTRGWYAYSFGDIASRILNDPSKVIASFGSYGVYHCPLNSMLDSSASLTHGEALSNDETGVSGSIIIRKIGSQLMSTRASGTLSEYTYSGRSANGIPYPDPITGGVILSPVLVADALTGDKIYGSIRGMWQICHQKPFAHLDTFAGTGDLAGKTFMAIDARAQSSTTILFDGQLAIEISDTWA